MDEFCPSLQFGALDVGSALDAGNTDASMWMTPPVVAGEGADEQMDSEPVVELAPGEGVRCVCDGTFEDNFVGSIGFFQEPSCLTWGL